MVYDPDDPCVKFGDKRYWPIGHRLYYSSLLGLVGVTEWVLGNALQAASDRGNEAVVRLLLEKGAQDAQISHSRRCGDHCVE